MRRILALAAVGALVASACAEDRPALGPGAEPSPTPAESAPPTAGAAGDDLAAASCERREGGDATSFPDFTEVKVESEDGTEKVEFRFEPEGDPVEPPLWFVGFVERLVTDGEGAPVEVAGEAFVAVSFMARGVDLTGYTPEQIYTGPTELAPGLSTVLELEQTGDFEGLVSWGIGLSREACFTVDARPDRLILEFPATL